MPNPICPDPGILKVKCLNTNEGANGLTIVQLAQQLAPVFGLSNMTLVVDKKTAGTPGGSFITGNWRVRDLNTILFGAQNIRGVTNNTVQIHSSPYLYFGWAPANSVDRHQTRVEDTTNNDIIESGSTVTANALNTHASNSIFSGFIPAKSPPVDITVFHRCDTTKNTDGFGIAGFGPQEEIYAVIFLLKLDGPES